MTNRYLSGLAFCALLLTAASAMAQQPITYQGQLKQAGTPFTGTPDLEFRLYDSLVSGTQIGPALMRPAWPVRDGLFQVELDFGAGSFGADPRWLEIIVDGVILNPRQAINPAPVALFALNSADGASPAVWSVNGTATYYDGGNVGVGFVNPPAPLTVRSAGRYAPFINNGFGDFYIGDGDIGFSIGVATAGGGRGVTRLWTNGGENRIKLGSAAFGDVLTVVGDRVGVRTGNGVPGNDLDVNGSVRVRGLAHGHGVDAEVRVQPDGDLVAQSPTRYMSIPGPAFAPSSFSSSGGNPGYTRTVAGGFSMEGGIGLQQATAPVVLPDGAVLEEMVLHALDNLSGITGGDLEVDLVRCDHFALTATDCTTVAAVSTSGASSGPQAFSTTAIAAPVVDNENNRYALVAKVPVGWDIDLFRILSVRLRYLH